MPSLDGDECGLYICCTDGTLELTGCERAVLRPNFGCLKLTVSGTTIPVAPDWSARNQAKFTSLCAHTYVYVYVNGI